MVPMLNLLVFSFTFHLYPSKIYLKLLLDLLSMTNDVGLGREFVLEVNVGKWLGITFIPRGHHQMKSSIPVEENYYQNKQY